MKKLTIKNRKNQKIVVVIDTPHKPKGLVIVLHGLSGNKEQPHIVAFAEEFRRKGMAAVRFDTTNTFGESDGNYEDATITNYYEDLEDVIAWAKLQEWYREPFYLVGHSLGGITVILYAEKHPEEIKGLAPISTVVSGALSAEGHGRDYVESWKKTGWRVEQSTSVPGRVKRLKWSHMEDRLKYNVLPETGKLAMPVLLIVGGEDKTTLPEHQKILHDALSSKKEFHIIKNAPHTFKEQAHLNEIRAIFSDWIDTVEKI